MERPTTTLKIRTQPANQIDVEKLIALNEQAVKLNTDNAKMNKEILARLQRIETNQSAKDRKLEAIDKDNKELLKKLEELTKDVFRMTVLWITGVLAMVGQLLTAIIKR